METKVAVTLDLKGLACPLPIVRTAKAMKELAPGQVLEAMTTDPGSVPDFGAWARATGNQLLESHERDGVYRFLLRRKEA